MRSSFGRVTDLHDLVPANLMYQTAHSICKVESSTYVGKEANSSKLCGSIECNSACLLLVEALVLLSIFSYSLFHRHKKRNDEFYEKKLYDVKNQISSKVGQNIINFDLKQVFENQIKGHFLTKHCKLYNQW